LPRAERSRTFDCVTGIALMVIAKEPLPGRAKTRLTPPCTPHEAAALAEAALLDTLEVVGRTPARRRVLVFDGDAERFADSGFEVIPQRGAGLGERLAAAFEDVAEPALLVGMDTPQLTSELLLDGIAALAQPGVDAVLGPTLDGGYWSIGLARLAIGAFDGVPMSSSSTWRKQLAQLQGLGLHVHDQPPLRDVDTIDDARVVARQAPGSRFARAIRELAA
jgi:rSAM/selenodomain-associated transferase 1